MKASDRLDRLRIASPCSVSWEQMTGDDRARLCEACNLRVYNFSEMTRTEAEVLVANTEGRICARFYRRSDGRVITKDCPVGARAIRRRVAKAAGAVFAAAMSLGASAMGQKQSAKDKSSCRQEVILSSESQTESSSVSGKVSDPMGAAVLGAKITLTKAGSKEVVSTSTSDPEGGFRLLGLASGSYDLKVEANRFKSLMVKDVKVARHERVKLDAVLMLKGTTEWVGIVVETPLIDTSQPGTTVISGDLIRRLPFPE
jgi:hypothetical protein